MAPKCPLSRDLNIAYLVVIVVRRGWCIQNKGGQGVDANVDVTSHFVPRSIAVAVSRFENPNNC